LISSYPQIRNTLIPKQKLEEKPSTPLPLSLQVSASIFDYIICSSFTVHPTGNQGNSKSHPRRPSFRSLISCHSELISYQVAHVNPLRLLGFFTAVRELQMTRLELNARQRDE
jgi:hypothetical protein